MAATGRSVDVQLIDLTRGALGVFDALTMMQQLGAVPQSPPG
jgi:hypothetical protein